MRTSSGTGTASSRPSRVAGSSRTSSSPRRDTATICVVASRWCGLETRSSPETRPDSRREISAKGSAPRFPAGHRAAESIMEGTEYRLDDLAAYSSDIGVVQRLLERAFAGSRLRIPDARPVAGSGRRLSRCLRVRRAGPEERRSDSARRRRTSPRRHQDSRSRKPDRSATTEGRCGRSERRRQVESLHIASRANSSPIAANSSCPPASRPRPSLRKRRRAMSRSSTT